MVIAVANGQLTLGEAVLDAAKKSLAQIDPIPPQSPIGNPANLDVSVLNGILKALGPPTKTSSPIENVTPHVNSPPSALPQSPDERTQVETNRLKEKYSDGISLKKL